MRKKRNLMMAGLMLLAGTKLDAQQNGLVNTMQSRYAVMQAVDLNAVTWTKGFWAERFEVCRQTMVPALWETYHSDKCHAWKNFEIAAGLDTGRFKGPSFHDGDFYKTLEAVAALYAQTRDPGLEQWMNGAIEVIGKAQKPDGYIYTKSIIEQRTSGKTAMFDDKLSFEAYNFGHLMTAACIHYRATGKRSLLDIAIKATDFLIGFYERATPEQARNAICPSHYMGIVEMYRTTGNPNYLKLVNKLIDIRGTTEGTDDNSDRVPFRQMQKVAGHAVRANYLFAGVADVYAETGDATLKSTLDKMWDNVVNHKMYITGGCGALYDGVSPDGTAYKPDTVQKTHQAYGKDFQLPNTSAHNETCANIGNVLWNWRMLLVTGDAKYADVLEQSLYNSVMSGISLSGTDFFYTNPLSSFSNYPYQLRWYGGRVPYISKSNCCPPNTVRTIAEVSNYQYSVAANALYVHLYSGNTLKTFLPSGEELRLKQESAYPWEGQTLITIEKAPQKAMAVYLRIPGWCNKASVMVNGKPVSIAVKAGTYAKIEQAWKAGDKISLNLDIAVQLVEANPLVEEARGQVAVRRGPLVYCVESTDLPNGVNVQDLVIPVQSTWELKREQWGHHPLTILQTTAFQKAPKSWEHTLYRPVDAGGLKPVSIKLIPYYAWANRGASDMSVWLPLSYARP